MFILLMVVWSVVTGKVFFVVNSAVVDLISIGSAVVDVFLGISAKVDCVVGGSEIVVVVVVDCFLVG